MGLCEEWMGLWEECVELMAAVHCSGGFVSGIDGFACGMDVFVCGMDGFV